MIDVDAGVARGLAARLGGLEVNPGRLLPAPQGEEERRRLANYWFFLVAMCQHTVSLRGTIEGRRLRGWDYLEAASRRSLEMFTATQLTRLRAQELRAVFSDDFEAAHSTLDRVEERLGQLRQCARLLLLDYGGDVNELYRHSGGRLAGEGGLLETLARFEPYSDPLQKKSFVFLMMVGASGVWDLKDPQALRVPIDYHIMRIALRSGLVRVTDPQLAHLLRERTPVSGQVDQLVRSRVEEACDLVVEASGRSVFQVDLALWHIGRNCCFYEHEPYCGPCPRPERCSLVEALGYPCPGRCPLDGACLGSRDPAYRAYWETNIYTSYY